MALKTLLAAGLTSVALAGGAAWGYIHYAEIFGNGSGCSSCGSAPTCALTTESEPCCAEDSAAVENCCEAPSRAAAVSQE